MSLTARILFGMAAGFVLGSLIHALGLDPEGFLRAFVIDGVLDVGGRIFIASLQLLVVPLVLVSLVCGASNLSDGAALGRLGGKTLALYLLTTASAISLALLVALIVRPGAGVDAATDVEFEPRPAPSFKEVILDIFPTNPVEAMAEGSMLQIIIFALLFGFAVARAGSAGVRIKAMFEDLNAVIMRLVTILIWLAPYGVFCLMATLFATMGWGEIGSLAAYFFTVVGVLLLHVTLVYPLLLVVLGRVSPRIFFLKMREPMLVAFSTSSSGATLPVTLETVRARLGVRNEVASFTVPLGATINMDGTAIMQGVATVFIAQYYGIELSLAQYLMVILTATLASVGTAGVPGVGLIMLTMVLQQVGLPVEGIMLIIGVDRLLDMMRTAVNVSGDGMVATVVGRSEDKLDLDRFNDMNASVDNEDAKVPTSAA
ncbi:MAG: dicarboxylate/amino acid:cation symporter [Gammaproteobacteria bacterium]|nr:dicarboxylate/amino acid:cation symporter [Gammaproteobacteria bacterium]